MKIKNLKNKTITYKVLEKHKKAYKIISIAVTILILPFFLFSWVLNMLETFAEFYCTIVMKVMTTLRDNFFKFVYFNECAEKEEWESDEDV